MLLLCSDIEPKGFHKLIILANFIIKAPATSTSHASSAWAAYNVLAPIETFVIFVCLQVE